MADVQRYESTSDLMPEMYPADYGAYVRYKDYATLQSTLAEVQRERDMEQVRLDWIAEHDAEVDRMYNDRIKLRWWDAESKRQVLVVHGPGMDKDRLRAAIDKAREVRPAGAAPMPFGPNQDVIR